ncbi:Glyoxalase/bleomycin resistance protein/dioxygenase [Halanaerobium saccharolyticum subsp. saccharolyticum DSM 6643]|uniref:Glyoxalase/bleomycin resistance protein/dioxygenase n=1 Tax=Halanaerobium saccharolyticum subsp. saccharolyticum DSM 6643 TaxID=1293054 RepID=M5DYQ2_9FIRM|nr:VOC family protein [Halanaerobium saccharolyticum]CCU78344.1 Glyoxalase/bleomycin resistance protein/dioxygenase [Halanaerobium saccharolyticum subsp. saccharolyticum DSM 6643]
MSFLWTTIKVKDLKESVEFYQDIVGLEVQRQFEAGPETEITFLAAADGQTAVELIDNQNQDEVELGSDISLGFEVDSLAEKMKLIQENNLKIHSGPISPNPNIEFFFVLDPNGLRIQFVENK